MIHVYHVSESVAALVMNLLTRYPLAENVFITQNHCDEELHRRKSIEHIARG